MSVRSTVRIALVALACTSVAGRSERVARADAAEESARRGGALAAIGLTDLVPVGFAVAVFENRTPYRTLDPLTASVPFTLAEKLAHNAGLRPTHGQRVLPEPDEPGAVGTWGGARGDIGADARVAEVEALARERGATWVFTGWVERPQWQLRLGIALWRVEDGVAALVGEVDATGAFSQVHHMLGELAAALCDRAGIPLSEPQRRALAAVPTEDFYAFSLFGRGMLALAAVPDRGAGVASRRAMLMTRAERWLLRAVFIDPRLAEAQRALATVDLMSGRLRTAGRRLDRALERSPRYYPAMAARAWLYADAGKLHRALEMYRAMLVARPWDRERRFSLGDVLWRLGEQDAAQAELERVIEGARPLGLSAVGDHLGARRLLALIAATRGDNDRLARELEVVVELDPTDVQSQLDLAAAYRAIGRDDRALLTYEGVVAANPRNAQALVLLGSLQARRDAYAPAVATLERAIAVSPADPRPYFALARLHAQRGRDREAIDVYRRALRFWRYAPQIYNNLGALSYRSGRANMAVWYYQRAVTKRPRDARYRYNLALVLSSMRELALAEWHVGVGLRLDPKHARLHYLRGVMALRRGRASTAREAFARALALAPDHADARHNLAVLDEIERADERGEIAVELPVPGAPGPSGWSVPGATPTAAAEPPAARPGLERGRGDGAAVAELSPAEPSNAKPGTGEAGTAELDSAEPSAAESGAAELGSAEPSAAESGAAEPSAAESVSMEPAAESVAEPGAVAESRAAAAEPAPGGAR